MALVEFQNVEKVYDEGRPNEYRALRGVSLSIERGELVAIMGASGSGKSTLLNLIGCLDVPSSGRFLLDGEEVSRLAARELVRIRREKVGFVFQNFNLLPQLDALGNVELPLVYRRVPRAKRQERARAALARVGLDHRLAFRPNELSGGEQQRVALARAIVGDPAIILADEPTGNLDSRTGEEIIKLLLDLHNQGRTVILVTHDEGVARIAQRRVRLVDGAVTS